MINPEQQTGPAMHRFSQALRNCLLPLIHPDLQALWSLLAFWLGAQFAVPPLLRNHLFWASTINTVVFAGLALSILGISLRKLSLLKTRTTGWIAFYYLLIAVLTAISPFVTTDNFFHVWGGLARSLVVTLAIGVASASMAPLRFWVAMGRAYIIGVLFTLLVFLAVEPSALLFYRNAGRLGDVELLHPNTLGMTMGIGLLLLIFLPIYRSLLARYFCAAVMAAALLATLSKSSILAVVLGAGFALLFMKGKKRIRLGLQLAAGLVAVLLVTGRYIYGYLAAYFSNPHLITTLTGRTRLWQVLLTFIWKRPATGYGFRVIGDVVDVKKLLNFPSKLFDAHNAYLDAFFAGGWLGLLVFSALIVRGIVVVLRCGFRFREGSLGPFLVGLLAFFIIRSVVEGGLHLGFDFWIFAAIVYSAERLMLVGDGRHGAATEGAPPAQPTPATQR